MDNVILPDDEVEQNPIVMSLVEYCEYAKYYIITNSKTVSNVTYYKRQWYLQSGYSWSL